MVTTKQVSPSEAAAMASKAAALASSTEAAAKVAAKTFSPTILSVVKATADAVIDSSRDDALMFSGAPDIIVDAVNDIAKACSTISEVASTISKLSGTVRGPFLTAACLYVAKAGKASSEAVNAVKEACVECNKAIVTVFSVSDPSSAVAAVSKASTALGKAMEAVFDLSFATNKTKGAESIIILESSDGGGSIIETSGSITPAATGSMDASVEAAASKALSSLVDFNVCLQELVSMVQRPEIHETVGEQRE